MYLHVNNANVCIREWSHGASVYLHYIPMGLLTTHKLSQVDKKIVQGYVSSGGRKNVMYVSLLLKLANQSQASCCIGLN